MITDSQLPMSLALSLSNAAERLPYKAAIIFGGRTLSYWEFDRRAQSLARRLLACGARRGDRIALHLYNGPELAISYFACFYAGIIAVPVNTRMKAPEIGHVLEHSGTSIYIGERELFQKIDGRLPLLSGLRRLLVDEPELDPFGDCSTDLPALALDQPAAILYTSGSTARPKGVTHTHRSLLNAARGFAIRGADTVTIITPMVHSAGFMIFLGAVGAAATAVAVAPFVPDAVLDAIEDNCSTYLLGMPVMYRALIAEQRARARNVSSVIRFLAAGDSVSAALQTEFAQCFGRPLYEVFGTTENGAVAANWSQESRHQGAFGWPAPGVEVAIVDRSGNPVPDGTEGEMIVRSAANMIGYWNDPDGTAKALRDGWFYTGDLVHQDMNGYLWFRGRKKEIIVRGGSNISPQEVEAVLYQHNGVLDAGVVGMPDAMWGERVVAFVSRKPRRKVSAKELIAFVAGRLAAYKIPEEIVFLDELPKSEAGKIQRRVLREKYSPDNANGKSCPPR
jgi:long-chain acyl-CoA synthetase